MVDNNEFKLEAKPRHKMPLRTKIIFYLVAWLIVLLPFLFWHRTWFGRPLDNRELTTYLHDDRKPRHIQHALVEIGSRIEKGDPGAQLWYPDLLRLAVYPIEEVRNTDAWVMGLDTSCAAFHEALLKMLKDSSPLVRDNAALALVRFGDASGRPQIVAMLQPMRVTSPQAGTVMAVARSGEPANHGSELVKLHAANDVIEVRAPISGRIKAIFAQPGARVLEGAELAIVNPGIEQVWEALRALYALGTSDDLPYVTPYKRETGEYPRRIAQQAAETERAILARTRK